MPKDLITLYLTKQAEDAAKKPAAMTMLQRWNKLSPTERRWITTAIAATVFGGVGALAGGKQAPIWGLLLAALGGGMGYMSGSNDKNNPITQALGWWDKKDFFGDKNKSGATAGKTSTDQTTQGGEKHDDKPKEDVTSTNFGPGRVPPVPPSIQYTDLSDGVFNNTVDKPKGVPGIMTG